jgi:hypothetical protein
MMIEARNNEFMSVADGLMLRRNYAEMLRWQRQ